MNRSALWAFFALLSIAVATGDVDRSHAKTDEEINQENILDIEEHGAAAQRKSLVAWQTRIEECRSLPASEAVPILGKLIDKLAHTNVYEVPERIEVYDLARKLLLSIPGHAEYFGNEIKRLTEEEFSGLSKESSTTRGRYFKILAELPSVETVRVLGELLSDERNPFKGTYSDSPWVANATNAAYTFHVLGLKNPPVGGKFGNAEADLPTWQLWYEQVRSGKRTFSFKGSDTVYTVNGVIPKSARGSSQKTAKTSVGGAHEKAVNPSPLPTYIALCLLLISIVSVIILKVKRR